MLDNMSRNGMHQMGFSKTRVSVKEKRIVNMQRRIFCYIECCRICHRIALTGYKGFKRMTLTQIRILIDQWLFFFFIIIGRNTIIFFINEVNLGDFFTFDDTFNRNTDIKIVTYIYIVHHIWLFFNEIFTKKQLSFIICLTIRRFNTIIRLDTDLSTHFMRI